MNDVIHSVNTSFEGKFLEQLVRGFSSTSFIFSFLPISPSLNSLKLHFFLSKIKMMLPSDEHSLVPLLLRSQLHYDCKISSASED